MTHIHTILGFETSTEASSLALLHNGKWYTRSNLTPKMHSELILPMLQSMLQEAKIDRSEVQAIATGIGPGSFTGVRLAVGLAQAFGFGLNIPIFPISTLSALAYSAVESPKKISVPNTLILSAWDARMQGIYWGLYRTCSDLGVQPLLSDRLSSPDEMNLGEFKNKPLLIVGSGLDPYFEKMPADWIDNWQEKYEQRLNQNYPSAKEIVLLAHMQIKAGASAVLPQELLPHYIRNNVAQVKKADIKKVIVQEQTHTCETA